MNRNRTRAGLRVVSEVRARKLRKLGVRVWWRPGYGWTWDPQGVDARRDPSVDPRTCHHVAEDGAHHFEWVDNSFDHEFGRHHEAGFGYCDCGADPNDHGAYDIDF